MDNDSENILEDYEDEIIFISNENKHLKAVLEVCLDGSKMRAMIEETRIKLELTNKLITELTSKTVYNAKAKQLTEQIQRLNKLQKDRDDSNANRATAITIDNVLDYNQMMLHYANQGQVGKSIRADQVEMIYGEPERAPLAPGTSFAVPAVKPNPLTLDYENAIIHDSGQRGGFPNATSAMQAKGRAFRDPASHYAVSHYDPKVKAPNDPNEDNK